MVKKIMNKKIMNKKSQNLHPCDFPRTDEKILGGEWGNKVHFIVPWDDQSKSLRTTKL